MADHPQAQAPAAATPTLCHRLAARRSVPPPPRLRKGGNKMRLPDVTDWARDTPVRVLRTVFAGIGQLVLVGERIRAEERDPRRSEPTPEPAGTPTATEATAAPTA